MVVNLAIAEKMLNRLQSAASKLGDAIRKPHRSLRNWRKRHADHQAVEARSRFDALLTAKSFSEASILIAELQASSLSVMASTLAERLHAEERAAASGLSSQDRVTLWWADKPYPGNIGDSFNPWLIEQITGRPVIRADPGDGVLLAVGSIAGRAVSGSKVWGSGFLSRANKVAEAASWHAVRGPISRAMVLQNGGSCPPIFGDPALVLPKYYPAPPQRGVRIGLVLHYSHRKLLKPGDARIVSTEGCGAADTIAFINAILECDYVFSSSLHGLVFANAYGIPARRCIFSDRRASIGGDDMKFADYWEGVELAEHEPLDLAKLRNFDEATLSPYRVPQALIKFDADALLSAFPWPN